MENFLCINGNTYALRRVSLPAVTDVLRAIKEDADRQTQLLQAQLQKDYDAARAVYDALELDAEQHNNAQRQIDQALNVSAQRALLPDDLRNTPCVCIMDGSRAQWCPTKTIVFEHNSYIATYARWVELFGMLSWTEEKRLMARERGWELLDRPLLPTHAQLHTISLSDAINELKHYKITLQIDVPHRVLAYIALVGNSEIWTNIKGPHTLATNINGWYRLCLGNNDARQLWTMRQDELGKALSAVNLQSLGSGLHTDRDIAASIKTYPFFYGRNPRWSIKEDSMWTTDTVPTIQEEAL